ncbi:MAG: hypothetical protein J6V80_05640 [Clostridia bacterium]|nr:hypothetical protein [Clostridia bacterium]
MDMFEEARSLAVMMKMRSLSQGEAAKMLGVSQSYVANKLRLLKLDEYEREKITSHHLTERHARALLRLRSTEDRHTALNKICERGMTVAEAEGLVGFMVSDDLPNEIGKADKLSRIDRFVERLSEAVKVLSSLGIDARQAVKYYGHKMVITIHINE